MFDTILRDHVFIDFGADYRFTDEQINLTYATRFPVVRFQLMATNLLVSLADRMRKDAGFTPFYPVDEYTESMCDKEGWYDFYIGLNGWSENKVDGCIEAVVCNSCSADDGELYTLDLTRDEQLLMYTRLDEQCRKYIGKSCEELLMEAEAEMKKRWGDSDMTPHNDGLFGLRKTLNKPVIDMESHELALNNCILTGRNAMYRDYDGEYDIRDLIREIGKTLNVHITTDDPETLDDMLHTWLENGFESRQGILALLYSLLWSKAELYEKLKQYEGSEECGVYSQPRSADGGEAT